jgi:hypothetical protein
MRYFAEKRSFATKFRGFEEIFDFFVFMIVVIMTETTIFVNIFDFDYQNLAESIGFEPMRRFLNDSLANCCNNHSANSP